MAGVGREKRPIWHSTMRPRRKTKKVGTRALREAWNAYGYGLSFFALL
jgi:hypothetical protein